MNFEQAVARLEAIVARLSDGTVPLEESLALFSEGAGLIGLCERQLGEAQLRIETLMPQKESSHDEL